MMQASYEHCQNLVQRTEKDWFLAILFAPAEVRAHLFALFAFRSEILGIPSKVREVLPGEIRYQWWRDALHGHAHGNVQDHPVAAALLDTIDHYQLPIVFFDQFLQAQDFDLYDDPMPSMQAFEQYIRDTRGVFLKIAGAILTKSNNDAMLPSGALLSAAYGSSICDILRAFRIHAARGKVYIPSDVLQKYGVDRDDIFNGQESPALKAVFAKMHDWARMHIRDMQRGMHDLDPSFIPILLPVFLVEPYLHVMERSDYTIFSSDMNIPQWRRQILLWRAARSLRRRFKRIKR